MSFRQKVLHFFLVWALVAGAWFVLGFIVDATLLGFGSPEFMTKMTVAHVPLVLIGSAFIVFVYCFVNFTREWTWGFKREKDSHFPGRHPSPPKE